MTGTSRNNRKTRYANPKDQAALELLLKRNAPSSCNRSTSGQVARAIEDQAAWLAGNGESRSCGALIRLDDCHIELLTPDPSCPDHAQLHQLLDRCERRAVQFGILSVKLAVAAELEEWLAGLGYRRPHETPGCLDSESESLLTRSLARRQTRFSRSVRAINLELGIPPDYGRQHRLALQPEASQLESLGEDVFGREVFLSPGAANAWFRMRDGAADEGIELLPVSAYRSVNYQRGLVERKLEQGHSMEQILAVSAAPGYSEHHTGRAIDITTPGFDVLEETFEHSPAFQWLNAHADDYGFRLSYPKNNRHHVAYEPWHWFYTVNGPWS